MKIRDLRIKLRQELIQIIGGIEDAKSWELYDATKSNSEIRHELKALFREYAKHAENYGIHLLEWHEPCARKSHTQRLLFKGRKRINPETTKYKSTDYYIFSKDINRICPCAPENGVDKSYVVAQLYARGELTPIGRSLAQVLFYMGEAIDRAEDKKPRSGIRENLLLAVLKLNDEIMPQAVDEYIARFRHNK